MSKENKKQKSIWNSDGWDARGYIEWLKAMVITGTSQNISASRLPHDYLALVLNIL